MGYSPIDLPARLRNYLGSIYLNRTVEQIEKYGTPAMHFGTGLYIRNFLRSLQFAWTDQELDDCWSLVILRAAGKEVPKPIQKPSVIE